MTKQDEKLRMRRRLQERAVDMALKNRWAEAIEANLQALDLERDVDTYNRLGKAYFELGQLPAARESYLSALNLSSVNRVAQKNLERIEELMRRTEALDRASRQMIDLRMFITETGRTVVTTLVGVERGPTLDSVVTSERVELRVAGRSVLVYDISGNLIGRVEPKLAQRLSELIAGGNRYIAAIAQTNRRAVRILIREVYQDQSQLGRVSFPGKLSESFHRGAMAMPNLDEYGDELLDEEEIHEELEDVEEGGFGGDEEELGLDEIEQDIGEDDDMNEE